MTCFLMAEPRAVFIHIPKTAGTSVRAMWAKGPVRRCYGHVPADWRDAPKFAVVRDPEARFLSAVRMFKFGTTGPDGSGEPPRMPGLTIEKALDILEHKKIGFDRVQRYNKGNLKHHLLPQTHPFNCLHMADHILRQEQLEAEIKKVPLDGLAPLPALRRSGDHWNELVLSDADRRRLHRIFAQDYEQLGYGLDGSIERGVSLEPVNEVTVWPLWPAFFSDQVVEAENAADALPPDDVDLASFVADVIVGVPKSTWPGRAANLIEHFHRLLPECVGQARIAHLAVCCIVVIRRTGGTGPGLALFHRILAEHGGIVFADMNGRWLTSVADTLVDHGLSDAQKALGLCASMVSAVVKLAETERQIYAVPRPWPPKARFGRDGVMYDGVISFWRENGDMIDNVLDRALRSVALDPIGGALVLEMTTRLLQHDTFFRRMAEVVGEPDPPMVSDDTRGRLERLVRKHL